MKKPEKVLDDIARLAGEAAGMFSGFTKQMRDDMRARVDEIAARMDLVPREDFDRLEAMLAQARVEQADMTARLERLERAAGMGKSAKEKAPKEKAPKVKLTKTEKTKQKNNGKKGKS